MNPRRSLSLSVNEGLLCSPVCKQSRDRVTQVALRFGPRLPVKRVACSPHPRVPLVIYLLPRPSTPILRKLADASRGKPVPGAARHSPFLRPPSPHTESWSCRLEPRQAHGHPPAASVVPGVCFFGSVFKRGVPRRSAHGASRATLRPSRPHLKSGPAARQTAGSCRLHFPTRPLSGASGRL